MKLVYEELKDLNLVYDVTDMLNNALASYPLNKYSIEYFISDKLIHLKVYQREAN